VSNLVPFQELEGMSAYIVRSKLFGAKDESQAMALMLLAQAEGLHPMTAIQDFDIVNGKPARKTHSILARFQSAGGSVAWEEITPTRACGTFSHPQGGSLRVEWTIADATKANLTGKDTWKNYPKAMLRARCIAEGVRAVYPAAIGGMMTVEEAQDIAPVVASSAPVEIDITPRHEQTELLECSAEKFAENEAAWRQLVTNGRKTALGLIAMLSTKTKLTDAQVETIRSWEAPAQ
jgi:hypothetical protein